MFLFEDVNMIYVQPLSLQDCIQYHHAVRDRVITALGLGMSIATVHITYNKRYLADLLQY